MKDIHFTAPRPEAGFRMPGYWVWDSSIIRGDDGLYHLFADVPHHGVVRNQKLTPLPL
jgi:hypothetical protein